MSKSDSLVYYKRLSCRFCKKVSQTLEDLGIQADLKNLDDDPALQEELISLGGKSQVPCLFINGKPLYESDAIVDYLKKDYK